MTVTVDNVGGVWANGERIGTVTADGIGVLRARLAGPRLPEGMTAERLRDVVAILDDSCADDASRMVEGWADALDEGTVED